MIATAPPPAVYTGVREIATTGTWYGELATARYDVNESYVTVSRRGRVATLRGTILYTTVAPGTNGIVLTAASIDQVEEVNSDGSVRVLSYRSVTHAAHLRDGSGPRASSSSNLRTVEMAFTGGATTIPRSLTPHREALPLAGTMRRTESDVGSMPSGMLVTQAESDVVRTIFADGAFEETGSPQMGVMMYRHRQQADGSATAYDGTPGFGIRDVTVAAPEGTGPGAHVAVTVKSQGRAIGPTPFVTHEYVVPMWYAGTWPTPLATATVTVEPRRSPDARCALGSTPLVPVVVERRQVDVTGRITEEREERDLDASRRVLCRLASTTTRRYDVTSGAVTGAIIDTTIVHMTGPTSRA